MTLLVDPEPVLDTASDDDAKGCVTVVFTVIPALNVVLADLVPLTVSVRYDAMAAGLSPNPVRLLELIADRRGIYYPYELNDPSTVQVLRDRIRVKLTISTLFAVGVG